MLSTWCSSLPWRSPSLQKFEVDYAAHWDFPTTFACVGTEIEEMCIWYSSVELTAINDLLHSSISHLKVLELDDSIACLPFLLCAKLPSLIELSLNLGASDLGNLSTKPSLLLSLWQTVPVTLNWHVIKIRFVLCRPVLNSMPSLNWYRCPTWSWARMYIRFWACCLTE